MPLYEDLKTGKYELRVEVSNPNDTFVDITKTYYQKGSQSVVFVDETSE